MTTSCPGSWLSAAAAAALVFQLGCSSDECTPVLDCTLKCGAVTDSCGGTGDCGPCTEVGVVPETAACPTGSEMIQIYMDDEDTNNQNSALGWTGATGLGPDTTWRFCRVAGAQFGVLPASGKGGHNHYAVLKLSDTCPRDAVEVIRRWDNEDVNNGNWHTPENILPNQQATDTQLRFCMFNGAVPTMQSFPELGMAYGVLAAYDIDQPEIALWQGQRYTDDEDDYNINGFETIPAEAAEDARRIINYVNDTIVYFAKVK